VVIGVGCWWWGLELVRHGRYLSTGGDNDCELEYQIVLPQYVSQENNIGKDDAAPAYSKRLCSATSSSPLANHHINKANYSCLEWPDLDVSALWDP
jgi:hypothetical protein